MHVADSRNTLHTGTIYKRDLMIPWEVCQWCNETNESLFVCKCVCLCFRARENKMSKGNIWRSRLTVDLSAGMGVVVTEPGAY